MALHPITIEAAGGEYMESVLVLDWAVTEGAAVTEGDLLLTVETAKAATEIHADRSGWLARILVPADSEAPVGAVLGQLSDQPGEEGALETAADAAPAPLSPAEPVAEEPAPKGGRIIASPLARRIAAQRGLSLEGLTGTGPNGRIKRRDVEKALSGPRPAAPALQHGARPPLVLLHGFAADRSSWRAVRALLPPGIEGHAPDLAGHGSRAAHPALSLSDLAADLSDRLARDGLEEIHLAGHSLGGAVALALLAQGRQVVRSLTLLAPAGLGPVADPGFLSGVASAETPAALQLWLERMVHDPATLPEGLAAATLAQTERAGNRAALQRMAANLFPGGTPAFDLRTALARVEVPLRLVWGREDAILSPATDPAPDHAALHLLRGIGHVPQLETPALTARLLSETLRSAG
ncbi:alpha/beta fold hydrolase [Pseudooceanicola albus]|nr:alpha/beta fold hydrolase [Pseudooceanicola albus]